MKLIENGVPEDMTFDADMVVRAKLSEIEAFKLNADGGRRSELQ